MIPSRVLTRVEKTEKCWLWTGPTYRNGYGYTRWKINGTWRHILVHRLFYEAHRGPIPDGLEINHRCKVRHCVNPDHLEAVTHAENLLTRNHRGPAPTLVCRKGHTKAPGRSCVLCNREASRLFAARRRAAMKAGGPDRR